MALGGAGCIYLYVGNSVEEVLRVFVSQFLPSLAPFSFKPDLSSVQHELSSVLDPEL